jgi:Arc/MetJ-type ribon-helix-helix transcriptional regulator
MDLSLSPEIQSFIHRQVKSGRFATPEAVIEAAIEEWRSLDEAEL